MTLNSELHLKLKKKYPWVMQEPWFYYNLPNEPHSLDINVSQGCFDFNKIQVCYLPFYIHEYKLQVTYTHVPNLF